MKIRSDFVTNSSSSSFVLLHAIGTDGTDYDLLPGGDGSWDEEHFPMIQNEKLVFSAPTDRMTPTAPTYEIKSPRELAAILLLGGASPDLYFYEDDAQAMVHDPKIIFLIFDYLCGEIKSRDFIEKLRGTLLYKELNSMLTKEIELAGSCLYESDELAETIIDGLSKMLCMRVDRDGRTAPYIALAKTVKSLADISRLELTYVTERWAGSLDDEYERIQEIRKTEHFSAVPEDDLGYKQAYKKWMAILKGRILSQDDRLEYFPEPDALVRKALASGDIQDLCPKGYRVSSKVVCDLP